MSQVLYLVSASCHDHLQQRGIVIIDLQLMTVFLSWRYFCWMLLSCVCALIDGLVRLCVLVDGLVKYHF